MSPIFKDQDRFSGQTIGTYGSYKPWSWHTKIDGGDRSNYPEYSGLLLDLKGGNQNAVDYFVPQIEGDLGDGFAITVVPSHDPNKNSGLKPLAAALASKGKGADASDCLVRTAKIEKLAHGGNRSIDVHLSSIKVARPELVKDQDVLVIDDITRTGNSLMACRKLLLDAGARSVRCIALGKTG